MKDTQRNEKESLDFFHHNSDHSGSESDFIQRYREYVYIDKNDGELIEEE